VIQSLLSLLVIREDWQSGRFGITQMHLTPAPYWVSWPLGELGIISSPLR